jgi:hypothetical protein
VRTDNGFNHTNLSVTMTLTSNAAHTRLFWFLSDDQLIVTGNVKEVVSIRVSRPIEDRFISKKRESGSVSKEEGKADGGSVRWGEWNHDLKPKSWDREPSKVSRRRVSKFGDPDQASLLGPLTSAVPSQRDGSRVAGTFEGDNKRKLTHSRSRL